MEAIAYFLRLIAEQPKALPTLNPPFPAFTVTDAKTGQPVPHTVTVREH